MSFLKQITADLPRLHVSTWVLEIFAVAGLLLANVPGERRDPFRSPTREGQSCVHGWPLVYLARDAFGPSTNAHEKARIWRLAEDVRWFDSMALAADILVAIAVLAAVAFLSEWRRRRRRHTVWQFSLAEAMLAVLVAGGVFRWWAAERMREKQWDEELVRLGRFRQDTVEPRFPDWFRDLAGDENLLSLGLNRLRGDGQTFWLPESEPKLAALTQLVDLAPAAIQLGIGCDRAESELAALPRLRRAERLTIAPASDVLHDQLAHLPNLRSLAIDDSGSGRPTAAGLLNVGHLRRLERLTIKSSAISDEVVAALTTLKGLEELTLDASPTPEQFGVRPEKPLTDASARELAKLKKLRTLRLSNTMLTDAGLAELAALSRLEALELSTSDVTGNSLAALRPLRRLRKLDLYGNPLGDRNLHALGSLKRLRYLGLGQTRVMEDSIDHLNALVNLEFLDLRDTEIAIAALERLELPALERLLMSGTGAGAGAAAARLRAHRAGLDITWFEP